MDTFEVVLTVGQQDGGAVSTKAVFDRETLAQLPVDQQVAALQSSIVNVVAETLRGIKEKGIFPCR